MNKINKSVNINFLRFLVSSCANNNLVTMHLKYRKFAVMGFRGVGEYNTLKLSWNESLMCEDGFGIYNQYTMPC